MASYFEKTCREMTNVTEVQQRLVRLHATGLRWLLNDNANTEVLERALEAATEAKKAHSECGESQRVLENHSNLFQQFGLPDFVKEAMKPCADAATRPCSPCIDSTPASAFREEPSSLCLAQASSSPIHASHVAVDEEDLPRHSRVVENHSTWAVGLKPLVDKIVSHPLLTKFALCINPGVLSTDSTYRQVGHLDEQETRGQTLRFAWRKGRQVQELTVTVKDCGITEDVKRLISQIALDHSLHSKQMQGKRVGITNDHVAPRDEKLERQRYWSAVNKQQLIQKHRKKIEKENEDKEAKKVGERAKKLLVASGNQGDVNRRTVKDYAIRDEGIVSGKCRSRFSMR